jgi:hypothetical protein
MVAGLVMPYLDYRRVILIGDDAIANDRIVEDTFAAHFFSLSSLLLTSAKTGVVLACPPSGCVYAWRSVSVPLRCCGAIPAAVPHALCRGLLGCSCSQYVIGSDMSQASSARNFSMAVTRAPIAR